MRLTPLDIRKQEFNRSFRGFDEDEVLAFLQMLSNQWQEAQDDHRRLEEKIRDLESKLKHYEQVEEALQEALKTARDNARHTVDLAESKARQIVDEAELKAQRITAQAEDERLHLKRETVRLGRRRNEIVARLRAFLIAEMEMLAHYEGDEPVGFIKLMPAAKDVPERITESRALAPPPAQAAEASIFGAGAPVAPTPTPEAPRPPTPVTPTPTPEAPTPPSTDLPSDNAAVPAAQPDPPVPSPEVDAVDEPEDVVLGEAVAAGWGAPLDEVEANGPDATPPAPVSSFTATTPLAEDEGIDAIEAEDGPPTEAEGFSLDFAGGDREVAPAVENLHAPSSDGALGWGSPEDPDPASEPTSEAADDLAGEGAVDEPAPTDAWDNTTRVEATLPADGPPPADTTPPADSPGGPSIQPPAEPRTVSGGTARRGWVVRPLITPENPSPDPSPPAQDREEPLELASEDELEKIRRLLDDID